MRRVALVVLGSSLALACASVLGVESISVVDDDAGTPTRLDANATPTPDAGDDAPTPGAECASDAGPAMVRVGPPSASFCIDATEVTFAQYAAFVAARAPDAGGQPAVCAWNTSFTSNQDASAGDHPVTGIDWCDALAYCAWAGKRLCGAIAGGALQPGQVYNAGLSQMNLACSRQGAQKFPYGNVYQAGACNAGFGDGGPEAVGTRPGCVGGYPGVHDLVGNVWELVDSCDGADGGSDLCYFAGGAWSNDPQNGCTFISGAARSYRANDVGFRCCAP